MVGGLYGEAESETSIQQERRKGTQFRRGAPGPDVLFREGAGAHLDIHQARALHVVCQVLHLEDDTPESGSMKPQQWGRLGRVCVWWRREGGRGGKRRKEVKRGERGREEVSRVHLPVDCFTSISLGSHLPTPVVASSSVRYLRAQKQSPLHAVPRTPKLFLTVPLSLSSPPPCRPSFSHSLTLHLSHPLNIPLAYPLTLPLSHPLTLPLSQPFTLPL